MIDDPSFWQTSGYVFMLGLANKVFFLKQFDEITLEEFRSDAENNSSFINLLFMNLWFIKDNSSTINTSFYVWNKKNTRQQTNHSYYSKADGTYVNTEFSLNEISDATAITVKMLNVLPAVKNTAKEEHHDIDNAFSLSFTSTNYNELHRLHRALKFLNIARNGNLTALKISFYVLIVECLFSTDDSQEISHKISERLAMYMGDTYDERISIFRRFKLYYGIRSKYIHGQILSGKNNSSPLTPEVLAKHSIELDELIRSLLIKIIMYDSEIFSYSNDKLNEWFNSLIFRKPMEDNLFEDEKVI